MSALAGKVALVTGASRGIGREIALDLARNGADLFLTARDEGLLQSLAGEIQALGRKASLSSQDLRQPDPPNQVVSAALSAYSRLDILINNAGATKRGPFLALTDDDWTDGYALKFFGAMRLCRAAWPHLKQSGGSIVNIAGVGGRTPGADFSIGGSVNAALLSFTKSLAELGISGGVQVNAINPGSVRTDRLTKRIQTLAESDNLTEAQAAQNLRNEARITRFGETRDVAALVTFLVSPQGRWMQGSLIDIDGGQTKTL